VRASLFERKKCFLSQINHYHKAKSINPPKMGDSPTGELFTLDTTWDNDLSNLLALPVGESSAHDADQCGGGRTLDDFTKEWEENIDKLKKLETMLQEIAQIKSRLSQMEFSVWAMVHSVPMTGCSCTDIGSAISASLLHLGNGVKLLREFEAHRSDIGEVKRELRRIGTLAEHSENRVKDLHSYVAEIDAAIRDD